MRDGALNRKGTYTTHGTYGARVHWHPLALWLVLAWMANLALAQYPQLTPTLPENQFRSGEKTLEAFKAVSEATRRSVVNLEVNGDIMALGAVVDTNGLVLTKASEIKPGKLTAWLTSGKEAKAEVLAVDEDEDVALVRVHAPGLKPVNWAGTNIAVGQWAITVGIAPTPHAVGIISALPHRIRPQRALIGVQFDFSTTIPRIETLLAGLSAEKAGLKQGDIIAAVNSSPVTNREQVVEMLREFREGQMVKLHIQRDTEEFDTELKMMVPKPDESVAGFFAQGRAAYVGRVSGRAEGFEQAIEHDTVLQPFLCGGPLVNLDGQAIGLNIARASRVTTYALPANLVQRILENLKAAVKKDL